MAIQNVNGRNAYVIQSEVPTAKTSSGIGYGSLYSTLRWKLWEKAEESVKQSIGFEKMAYEAQLEYAMKQRSDIQRRLSAYDKQISALQTGEAKDNARVESKRDDDALKVARDTRAMDFSANKAAAPSTREKVDVKSSSSTKVSGVPVDIPEGATGSQVPAGVTSPIGRFVPEGVAIPVDAKLPDGSYAVAGSLAPAGGILVELDAAPTSLASPPPPAAAPKAPAAAAATNADPDAAAFSASDDKKDKDGRPRRSDIASETTTEGSSVTTKARAAVPKAPNLPVREDVDYSETLAALIKERETLQAELGGVTLPTAPSIDLLERTRAKYEQSYGVGGMFGIAPRRDKIQPRFDDPASLQRAQAIAASAADEALKAYTEDKLRTDPNAIVTPEEAAEVRRRGVLSAIGKLGGREVTAKDFLGVDGREAPIERRPQPVVEAPVAREAAKSGQFTAEDEFIMEALPERAGQSGMGSYAGLPYGDEILAAEGGMPPVGRGRIAPPVAGETVPLPPTAGMEPSPVQFGEAGAPPSYAEAMEGFRTIPTPREPTYAADGLFPVGAEMPRLRKPSRFPIDRTTPEGRAFEEETRRIEAEKKAAGTYVRNPFGRTAVERTQDLLSLGMTPEEIARIAPQAAPIAPIAPPVAAPIQEPSIWDTIDREPIAAPPVAPPVRGPETAGITVPPVARRSVEELKADLEELKKKKDKTAAEKKAVEDLQKQIGLDQLPSKEEVKPSGSLERREGYKLALLEKATKLANQPKKFERLAKPNLPPEQRKAQVPEYIILVDNLYDSNERSGNEPVKASFQEINRVFADKPEVRAAAGEYLLAKDLLNSKTQNPEA
jgi:hypothetical protein